MNRLLSAGRNLSGFALIVGATGIAGIAAYVITWLVPNLIGDVDYKIFAVFWAALFLVVTALSGIQQEVTRATRPLASVPVDGLPGEVRPARAARFATLAAVVVLLATLGTAPLWQAAVFPELGWALVVPLSFGVASFVFVATVCGTLYGLESHRPLALLIVVDPILRLATVGAVSLFSGDLVALAWAATIPFLGTLVLLWPLISAAVRAPSQLDVGYRALIWNVTRTLGASASTGALIAGLPLLISVTGGNESAALLSTLFLTITLTRAPLVVTLMSIQGYLIVHFREHLASVGADLRKYLLLVAATAAVLSVAAWLLGPPVFGFLFPSLSIVLDGWFFAVLVGSSALLGSLCITGPAVLARGSHSVYSIGWISAAVTTIIALALPLELLERTTLALVAGPIAGLVVHGVRLVQLRGGGTTA